MCSIRQMALRLCVPRLKIVYQVINTHNSVDRYSNIFLPWLNTFLLLPSTVQEETGCCLKQTSNSNLSNWTEYNKDFVCIWKETEQKINLFVKGKA